MTEKGLIAAVNRRLGKGLKLHKARSRKQRELGVPYYIWDHDVDWLFELVDDLEWLLEDIKRQIKENK